LDQWADLCRAVREITRTSAFSRPLPGPLTALASTETGRDIRQLLAELTEHLDAIDESAASAAWRHRRIAQLGRAMGRLL